MWSYASFALGAMKEVCFGKKAEVIVTMTTPPLLGLLGWLGQLRGAKHYIWEMDLYPDVAVELGVFARGGVADRLSGSLADFPRRRADGIVALGPCMASRLQQRSVGGTPVHIVHNWADGSSIRQQPFSVDGKLKIFYSGNMGLAHDFETLLPVLRDLGAKDEFQFLFSGGGPRRADLELACSGLGGCQFSGYHERQELGRVFGRGDVGLVTQRAGTAGTVVPSKLYGILAAGRGVVFIGPPQATAGRLIDEHSVGWRVDNGDVHGLTALLCRLQANPEELREAGNRARVLFEREFERAGQVEKVLDICGLGSHCS